jgi:hypothetical protein
MGQPFDCKYMRDKLHSQGEEGESFGNGFLWFQSTPVTKLNVAAWYLTKYKYSNPSWVCFILSKTVGCYLGCHFGYVTSYVWANIQPPQNSNLSLSGKMSLLPTTSTLHEVSQSCWTRLDLNVVQTADFWRHKSKFFSNLLNQISHPQSISPVQ